MPTKPKAYTLMLTPDQMSYLVDIIDVYIDEYENNDDIDQVYLILSQARLANGTEAQMRTFKTLGKKRGDDCG